MQFLCTYSCNLIQSQNWWMSMSYIPGKQRVQTSCPFKLKFPSGSRQYGWQLLGVRKTNAANAVSKRAEGMCWKNGRSESPQGHIWAMSSFHPGSWSPRQLSILKKGFSKLCSMNIWIHNLHFQQNRNKSGSTKRGILHGSWTLLPKSLPDQNNFFKPICRKR